MIPIRVGEISFTNMIPLTLFLKAIDLNVQFISQVPTSLNKGIQEGSIDLGPISSFEYGENQDKYVLLPHLSISSMGPVRSIYLFTKGKTIDELDGAHIAVTNTSATSFHLLRILLEKFEEVFPHYIRMDPTFDEMMERYDACLLIGDEAIRAYWEKGDYFAFDLGEEWGKRTNKPMTFAVFAVRKEIIKTRKVEINEIYSRFLQAKKQGQLHLSSVIKKAMDKVGGSSTFWNAYYKGLCYDLGDEEIAGLELFYDHAFDLGLIPKRVHIELFK